MVVRDLWAGADVAWVGPGRRRRGARLRSGDRAVVVDPGRHHVSSFGTLYHPAGSRPPRPSRRVRIRLADGSEVAVARKDLEIVAPDHPLSPEPDVTAADWWLAQLVPWGRQGVPVASLVPAGFDAVGQVLHPFLGPDDQPVRWREVASRHGFPGVRALDQTRADLTIPLVRDAGLSAAQGDLDELTATALVEVLTAATTSPDDVFVAVWTGWGDVPPQRFPGAAHLDTLARSHFLVRGPLHGVLTSVAASGMRRPAAGLWWPADRAWFVATEIDFEWTFVAGSHQLLRELARDDRLEVAATTFDAPANEAAEPA